MPAALRAGVLFADERVLTILMVVVPRGARPCSAAGAVRGGAPEVECSHVFRDITAAFERVKRIVRLARLPIVVIDLCPV